MKSLCRFKTPALCPQLVALLWEFVGPLGIRPRWRKCSTAIGLSLCQVLVSSTGHHLQQASTSMHGPLSRPSLQRGYPNSCLLWVTLDKELPWVTVKIHQHQKKLTSKNKVCVYFHDIDHHPEAKKATVIFFLMLVIFSY